MMKKKGQTMKKKIKGKKKKKGGRVRSGLPLSPPMPFCLRWSALSDRQPPQPSPSRSSNWRAGDGRNQASRSKIKRASSRVDEEMAESRGHHRISMRIEATLDRSNA
jgi:hypothetical protein